MGVETGTIGVVQISSTALAKIAAAPVPSREDVLRNKASLATSKRHGGELRGNSRDRRARALKLLLEFGNGSTCECVYCGDTLTVETLQQDKIYTCSEGGRYQYANLLPACKPCNQSRCDKSVREWVAAIVAVAA